MKDTHVEVLVNGRTVKQYQHTTSETYIEARAGTEYSIKIKNNAYCRKLAVITVDGLNVITGEIQPDGVGRGYIVPARDSIEIRGFRKDTDSVGAFKFCKKGNSYCNEKGLKGNNGVIGVRMYGEITQQVVYKSYHWYSSSLTSTDGRGIDPVDSTAGSVNDGVTRGMKCCYTSSVRNDFDLGTTWGKKIDDAVTYVDFEVDANHHEDHIIYYDTRENLEKIGISFKKETQVASHPKAFGAFAKPPANWKG